MPFFAEMVKLADTLGLGSNLWRFESSFRYKDKGLIYIISSKKQKSNIINLYV